VRAVEVRRVEAAEVHAWVANTGVGFLVPVADGYADYLRDDLDLERTWGAFDGERVVGTLRSFPTAFTVPGPSEVTAAALTQVTVAPTHRRRGLLTEMIGNDLRASAERGEPVGILVAAEYPIYGRYGYGAAVEAASYAVDLASTRFRRPAGGEVELVDLAGLGAVAPALYERFRATRPASIERPARWWDRTLHQVEVPGATPPTGYQALYRSEGGDPEGYVRYQAKQGWDDMRKAGKLTVDELLAVTPAAYERLWRHCCEVDLVKTVVAGNRPVDEPLAWLLEDGRAVRQTARFDFVWVRILDPAAALAARRYGAPCGLVVEVVDPAGYAAGRFALEGGPDGATCTSTTREADLTMPVDALGSLYAGGVSALALADSGRIDEHRAGALALAEVAFRGAPAPWCATWF